MSEKRYAGLTLDEMEKLTKSLKGPEDYQLTLAVLALIKEMREYERDPKMDLSVWPEDLQRLIRKTLALGKRMVEGR